MITTKAHIYLLACFVISFFLATQVQASHVSGGDISYVCNGNGSYTFTLSLYRRCSGVSMSSSASVSFNSSCGNQTVSFSQIGPSNGVEISQLCPPQTPNSECNGGSLPGLQRYDYQATVTLPPCADWTISWGSCCRNTSVNVANSYNEGIYIEATMNNVVSPCNNSPVFSAQPIPYVCVNQPVTYNFGVIEIDGDSLVYSFIDARDNSPSGQNLSYNGGFSATNAINGITIDPQTGQLNFTATTIGNFIVVVLVEEYDANGNLIGTVMRDIQFVVENCSNNPPDINAGTVTNAGGQGNVSGPYEVQLCEGDSIYFEMIYTDPDAIDSIVLVSNVNSVLPTAQFNWVGGNPAVASFSWVAPPGSSGLNTAFSVTADDQACPISAFQTFVYDIQVTEATVVSPDVTICPNFGITAELSATGGTIFNWTVISGDPINVGTNFSCNPCDTVIANPSVTTVYEVSSNLVTTCDTKDTVTVTVNNVITTPHSLTDSFCLTAPTYTYTGFPTPGFWAGTMVTSTGDFDPGTAGIGTHTIIYTTIDSNCLANDRYTIDIDVIGPDVNLTAHDTSVVCANDLVQIEGLVSGGILPHQFWWSNDPTATNYYQTVAPDSSTTYTLFATDFCAVDTAQINIYVDVPIYTPIVLLGGDTIDLHCPGHPVNYKPSAAGGSGSYIFTWDNWLTTDSVLADNPDSSVNYVVQVTDFCKTDTVIDTVPVIVPNYQPLTIQHEDTVYGCAGDEFELFTLATGGSGGYTFWWDKLLEEEDSIVVEQYESELHTLVVTDDCYEDDTIFIFAYVKEPTANFEAKHWDLQDIEFVDRSKSDIVSWNWDFGDGGDSEDQNPVYSYSMNDIFTVTLEVTNDQGCIDSISKFIEPPLSIWIPTAFSPNNDNVNDFFEIKTIGVEKYEIKIFNRWGDLMFTQTNPNTFWDGKFNGNFVKDGVYIYEVKAAGITTERFNKRGTVTIIK
ncbi:MAG: gliding motility-associated C-terminal domain-containing protein [Flavobacteriales bacterium]|nr:gliding motility-associated C-terminal domain-containing protein [Flavobacteriales bacterium]